MHMVSTEIESVISEALSFKLVNEYYGIDILKVQEIRGYEAVTKIASAPDFIKGVINLRGIIEPIVAMRIRINLEAPSYDQFTVVIVLNIASRIIGMVVDSVSDVITGARGRGGPAPGGGAAGGAGGRSGRGTRGV